MSRAGEFGSGRADRRNAPAGRLRLVAALAAIFVAYLLSIWASEIISSRPNVALLLNPYNATALITRAEAALEQDPPEVLLARRFAGAALRADPLAPGAHRALARTAAESDDEEAAEALTRLSARYARDGDAQLGMLQRALAAREFDKVVHRLDLIYRGQGEELWGRLGPAFANVVNEPQLAAALARKLGEGPPWRRSFLEQSFARAASVDALIQFYTLLPNPQDAETRLFLERLVREGRYDVAHALFVRMLPPERRQESGLLYNARFQYGVSNLPFDWVFTRMPNTLTKVRRDRSRRLLRVSFFGGRTPFKNVSHLLALAPGSYIFSGSEQALSLNNPRGMQWKIACTDKLEETIAATELLAGDVPLRPFAVSFDVAEQCPFQILQLELASRVALEQEATGTVVYTDLSVAPKPRLRNP